MGGLSMGQTMPETTNKSTASQIAGFIQELVVLFPLIFAYKEGYMAERYPEIFDGRLDLNENIRTARVKEFFEFWYCNDLLRAIYKNLLLLDLDKLVNEDELSLGAQNSLVLNPTFRKLMDGTEGISGSALAASLRELESSVEIDLKDSAHIIGFFLTLPPAQSKKLLTTYILSFESSGRTDVVEKIKKVRLRLIEVLRLRLFNSRES